MIETPKFQVYRVPVRIPKMREGITGYLPKCVPCVFKTKVKNAEQMEHSNLCMAIIGSIPQLGFWDRRCAVVAYPQSNGLWQVKVNLPQNSNIEYKWIIYEKKFFKIMDWEEGGNRKLYVTNKPLLIEDFQDQVHKVTEISTDELNKITQRFKEKQEGGSEDQQKKQDETEVSNQSNTEKYLPSGYGPFLYDEFSVKLVKQLNPRIYVPDEYKNGKYENNFGMESHKKEVETGGQNVKIHNENRITSIRKTYFCEETTTYGQELEAIFSENEHSINNEKRLGVVKEGVIVGDDISCDDKEKPNRSSSNMQLYYRPLYQKF